MNYQIKRLGSADLKSLKKLLPIFAQAFQDAVLDSASIPDDAELVTLLGRKDVYILVALDGEEVLGGLTGYTLVLPTKKEKEMYLYDLAVDEAHRRKGIARALINELRSQAKKDLISTIFVEAESVDAGAVAFYQSLGAEQLKVDHFNIKVE